MLSAAMPPKPNHNGGETADSTASTARGKKPRPKKAGSSPPNALVNDDGTAAESPSIPEPTDTCTVCCEDVRYYAVGQCNHRAICHMCSLRMRWLSKQTYCVLCRADCKDVVFTKDARTPFADLPLKGKPYDTKLNVYFASAEALKEVKAMFLFPCQICSDVKGEAVNFDSVKALKEHLKKEHELFLCELCLAHLKIFPREQKLYSRNDLARHRRFGDAGITPFKVSVCL